MKNLKTFMSQEDYEKIMSSARRIDGTLGLVDGKPVFRAFHHNKRNRKPYSVHHMKHGKAVLYEEEVTLSLKINRSEMISQTEKIDPIEVIYDEADDAADFLQKTMED